MRCKRNDGAIYVNLQQALCVLNVGGTRHQHRIHQMSLRDRHALHVATGNRLKKTASSTGVLMPDFIPTPFKICSSYFEMRQSLQPPYGVEYSLKRRIQREHLTWYQSCDCKKGSLTHGVSCCRLHFISSCAFALSQASRANACTCREGSRTNCKMRCARINHSSTSAG
jgi:hypothetical protein